MSVGKRDTLGGLANQQISYGTYDEMQKMERMHLAKMTSAIRERSSSVHVNSSGGDDVGAQIQGSLEEIFARASEGAALYHKLGQLSGISEALQTDTVQGISSSTANHRRDVFGANVLPEDPPVTFWQVYAAAWRDKMIILLSLAAVVSLVLGLTVPEPGETEVNFRTGWVEGFAILCSVLIVTTVSSVNDYRKEQKFRRLTEANSAQPIHVMRDGVDTTIDVSAIVVGDIVSLSPGLVVPVDGFYVRGMSVVLDESSVTGENDPKKKNVEAPIILTGTVVNTAEEAYMLACAVGERSFGGKLLMESRQSGAPRPTPLQERLDDLAELIGRAGLIASAMLFTILSVMEVVRLAERSPEADPRHFLDYFLLCVAVVVVAVPEGLPLAVTIALAYSQNKMHEDNNQVRRLRACETMGNATQICSDKTGTLTQNVMSVVQGYVGMVGFSINRPGDLPEPIELSGVPAGALELLTEGISVNSSSEKRVLRQDKEGHEVSPYWQWASEKGNKTDNALLDLVDRMLMGEAGLENMESRPHQRIREEQRARGYAVFPFTSDRKRMSAVVQQADGSVVHHVKGGSDRVLPLCNRYVDATGAELEMTDEIRAMIAGQVSRLAKEANRTIGVAYVRLGSVGVPEEEPAEPLVWLGLLGIQDPLRPEVPEAVRKCQMAGVTVRMCTGDNLDTAVAISRQCGIFSPFLGDIAMTGQDFRNLVYDAYGDEEQMAKVWPILDRMTVMARSQPLDKQLLVLMLMMRGEVVAVTGDGTNDAPALRLANVGFVMRSGTDIAVKSADIVLLDDNFRSVQRAVVWGRCVNDNIRKFLQLQLTVNYVSVALTFVGSIVERGASSPLATVQLLWVNLIMDTLAALALGTEEPSEDCLRRGPVSRKASLISYRMHITIAVSALYLFGITFCVQMFGAFWLMEERNFDLKVKTVLFNVFVFGVLFHMLNCRKLYEELNVFEGLWSRSKPFLVVMAFCVAFQVLAVETFGDFMRVTPLNAVDWSLSLVLSLVVLVSGLLSRLVPVSEPVYKKEFEMENLDDDVKRMLVRLEADVLAERQKRSGAAGVFVRGAQRLRAQALWCQVRQHHINANKVIKAFRRAREEGLVRENSLPFL